MELAQAVEKSHIFSGNGFTQQEVIDAAIKNLIEESKLLDVNDGYIHLRLREILGGSKWSYLLIPLQKIGEALIDAKTKHLRMIKYIYDCWLIINGLKVSKF